MPSPAVPSLARAGVLVLVLATTGAAPGSLPPIVFVSRAPVPGEPLAIPGLGPHQRAVVTGGRLLLREPDGRVRELLPPGAFHDVSDPTVSPDARRVAFAGATHPDSAWRIWVLDLDRGGRGGITRIGGAAPDPGGRHDDLDPCWIDDSSLVFASTRDGQRAQYADVPVSNLFLTSAWSPPGHGEVVRITAERNGAEEPAMDWASGRLVFSRWWFNRYRAAERPDGITEEPAEAMVRDTVNLWQVMEMSPRVRLPRLAAGDLSSRRATMGYQPTVLADGSIAAVYAANLGLSPGAGAAGIQRLSRSFGRSHRLAGAIVPGRAGDAYGGAQGLAPPSACAPAALPDGRVLFSYSPGARGDFGLYVVDRNGEHLARVLDLEGTLELDAAPVVRHRVPPGEPPAGEDLEDATSPAEPGTFRYHALDVFADGPPGSPARGAPPRTPGTLIRFYATVPRPGRPGGDSAVLVREARVGPNGEVDERGLPAGTPLFEQLKGPDGRVLMTAHGPAHVAGSNAGVAGVTSRCRGCHLGHSTLPARRDGR